MSEIYQNAFVISAIERFSMARTITLFLIVDIEWVTAEFVTSIRKWSELNHFLNLQWNCQLLKVKKIIIHQWSPIFIVSFLNDDNQSNSNSFAKICQNNYLNFHKEFKNFNCLPKFEPNLFILFIKCTILAVFRIIL